MEDLCNKYHLKYRFVPAEKHYFKKERGGFWKNSGLESRVAVFIAGCGFLLSILFSSGITSLAISNLSQADSKNIGIIFFIVSLISFVFLLNKRKLK